MFVINHKDTRLPVMVWLSGPQDLDETTLEQARNLANLPFAYHHIALMPDTHAGYGMPIGGVMACEDVVVPYAVGVDIGCGMRAACTLLHVEDLSTQHLKQILGAIRELVPVGFSHHDTPVVTLDDMPSLEPGHTSYPVLSAELESVMCQAGTLGGGNHFIELQRDAEDRLWVMIHSGSRNLGKKVADHYNKEARRLNALWHTSVPAGHNLAFLPVESEIGRSYLREMNFCLEFARLNRQLMLEAVSKAVSDVVGDCSFEDEVDIHHNYARLEHHYGKDLWVHRKGATCARSGDVGIIPGSQGSKSYIVTGLGHPLSFTSCSHGAGRKMSRSKARQTLRLQEEIDKLDEIGVVHGIRSVSDLDEAPSAYKDIAGVMSQQSDLVDIKVELTPVAVVKG